MESEQIARTIAGAGHSATWINKVVGGDMTWFTRSESLFGVASQATINKHMQNNIDHIVQALANQDVIDDSSDKSSYTGAITVGNQYITDNS
tara:strand:+ start:647 stop:922 length:276 start_codon:yes stop_codon:yes gene_type:complete